MERKRRNHTKRIVNLIIVDESGSMSLIKKQALMGLNETLNTVKRMQEKEPNAQQYVTLLTFNSDNTHYVFDNTPAKRTHTMAMRLVSKVRPVASSHRYTGRFHTASSTYTQMS